MKKLNKSKHLKLLTNKISFINNFFKPTIDFKKSIYLTKSFILQYHKNHLYELNNYSTFFISKNIFNINDLYTISKRYNNKYLFNYKLNYEIIKYFNHFYFKTNKLNRINIYQGKCLYKTYKNIFFSVFGRIFIIKPLNLTRAFKLSSNINSSKKKKFNKKKLSYYKKRISNYIFNKYKFKSLYFKLNISKQSICNEYYFSRISYLHFLKHIYKNYNYISKPNLFSRTLYVDYTKKKKQKRLIKSYKKF